MSKDTMNPREDTKSFNSRVGEYLRFIREARGFSMVEVERRARLYNTNLFVLWLDQKEHGESEVTLRDINVLAQIYGLDTLVLTNHILNHVRGVTQKSPQFQS